MTDAAPEAADPFVVLRDRSISMEQANLGGLIAGFLYSGLCLIWQGIVCGWSQWSAPFSGFFGNVWWIPATILGIVIHEWIHGLSWTLLGRLPRGSIRYGFDTKTLTPFAHCRVPMAARPYWLGAAMPGWILGLLPGFLGPLLDLPFLTGFGWLMTMMAGGDVLILSLLWEESATTLVRDHPRRCGCEVVEPQKPPA